MQINKDKSFFKEYHIEIYSYRVLFSYNQTNDEFYKSVKKHFKSRGIDEEDDSTSEDMLKLDHAEAMTYFLSHRTVAMRVFKHSNKDFNELMDSLCHEALHVTCDITKGIQIELSEDTEEVFCYLIGHIINKIVKDLVKL